jgi:hypothetical protein
MATRIYSKERSEQLAEYCCHPSLFSLTATYCIACHISLSLSHTHTHTHTHTYTRPLPQWYGDAKVGIFIHWGVFSVPSFKTEWFWWNWEGTKKKDFVDFVKATQKPGFAYADYAHQFDAIL